MKDKTEAMEPVELNDRQERFCENLVRGMSATQAYISAGYSPNGAGQSAASLLKNPKIDQWIETLRSQARERAQLSRDEFLQELHETYKQAMENCAFGPAVSALNLYGRVSGFMKEKSESGPMMVTVIDRFECSSCPDSEEDDLD